MKRFVKEKKEGRDKEKRNSTAATLSTHTTPGSAHHKRTHVSAPFQTRDRSGVRGTLKPPHYRNHKQGAQREEVRAGGRNDMFIYLQRERKKEICTYIQSDRERKRERLVVD